MKKNMVGSHPIIASNNNGDKGNCVPSTFSEISTFYQHESTRFLYKEKKHFENNKIFKREFFNISMGIAEPITQDEILPEAFKIISENEFINLLEIIKIENKKDVFISEKENLKEITSEENKKDVFISEKENLKEITYEENKKEIIYEKENKKEITQHSKKKPKNKEKKEKQFLRKEEKYEKNYKIVLNKKEEKPKKFIEEPIYENKRKKHSKFFFNGSLDNNIIIPFDNFFNFKNENFIFEFIMNSINKYFKNFINHLVSFKIIEENSVEMFFFPNQRKFIYDNNNLFKFMYFLFFLELLFQISLFFSKVSIFLKNFIEIYFDTINYIQIREFIQKNAEKITSLCLNPKKKAFLNILTKRATQTNEINFIDYFNEFYYLEYSEIKKKKKERKNKNIK